MGKARSLNPAWATIGVLVAACQSILGADFDKEYDLAGPGKGCAEDCVLPEVCNPVLGRCQCQPLSCETSNPAHECGSFIETQCNQPVDCGACPNGLECTNTGPGQPNRCTPASTPPCRPQSCAELGQTSGVHFSCGILVNCNALPNCGGDCSSEQVCTETGCCTPALPKDVRCGKVPDGCGRVTEFPCKGNAVCVNGECCAPTQDEIDCVDKKCGLNPTECPNLYTECPGTCDEGDGECRGETRFYCDGSCTGRTCPDDPALAKCGLNDDGCGGQIQCFGRCEVPTDVCLGNFTCCTPRCPATPQACGENDNGCGGKIQCPGRCPAGNTCKAAAEGTFACSP